MSSTAYFIPQEREINTAELEDDPELYAEIIACHGKSTRDNPKFRCLERAGNKLPMMLKLHHTDENGDPVYFLAHFPRDNPEGHQHDTFTAPMTVEHKQQTEYIERAAQSAGLETQRELSTGKGTRLDLAVYGKANAGFEIQWSALSVDGAKGARGRATKSFEGGWPTVWVTTTDPTWFGSVPSIRITGMWGEQLPPPGTVYTMISEFSRQMRWPEMRLERKDKALLLDEFVPLVTSGDIIPVVAPDGVTFTDSSALDMLTEFEGCGTWTPSYTRRARSAQRTRRCLSHEKPPPPVFEPPPPPPVTAKPTPDPCQECHGSHQAGLFLRYSGTSQKWLCPTCFQDSPTRDRRRAWLDAERVWRQSWRDWLNAERAWYQSWLDAEKAWHQTWLDTELAWYQSWPDAERAWYQSWLDAERAIHTWCKGCGHYKIVTGTHRWDCIAVHTRADIVAAAADRNIATA